MPASQWQPKFSDRGLFAHGNGCTQHVGHGALMVRKQTAVGAEHSMRSAKPFVGIARSWRPAPWFGSAAVVLQNETIPVADIDGRHVGQPPTKACVQFRGPGTQSTWAHIAGMRLHAIFMITASAMVALSVFFVLRPQRADTGARSPHGGLIAGKCTPAPD